MTSECLPHQAAKAMAQLPERLAKARRVLASANAYEVSEVRFRGAAAAAAAAAATEEAAAATGEPAEDDPSWWLGARSVEGSAPRPIALDEAQAVQQRLREHADDLREEARHIEQFRQALAARQGESAGGGGATPSASQASRVTFAPTPKSTAGRSAREQLFQQASAPLLPAPTPTYNLRSLADSLEHEETWWERYRRDVLMGAEAAVAELE
jgi:hypothetical protein